MAGLVPAIHAAPAAIKTWMRGTSPRMTALNYSAATRSARSIGAISSAWPVRASTM